LARPYQPDAQCPAAELKGKPPRQHQTCATHLHRIEALADAVGIAQRQRQRCLSRHDSMTDHRHAARRRQGDFHHSSKGQPAAGEHHANCRDNVVGGREQQQNKNKLG